MSHTLFSVLLHQNITATHLSLTPLSPATAISFTLRPPSHYWERTASDLDSARRGWTVPELTYSEAVVDSAIPEAFTQALLSIRRASRHRLIERQEVPPPSRLAPFSAALALHTRSERNAESVASGHFVVLYDPNGQLGWNGDFRLVAHIRSEVDDDMGRDPLLAEALWGYADECLREADPAFHDFTGSVTREISESFGNLQLRGSAFTVELRASWTPSSTNIGAHLGAWENLMALTSGAYAPRFLQGV